MPTAIWYSATGETFQRKMGTPKRVADLNAWLKMVRKLIPAVPSLLVNAKKTDVSLELIEVVWPEGKLKIIREREGVAG